MKIVVAVDDSKFSQAALQTLIRQVSPRKAEVRVLNVVEPISISPPPQMAAGYIPELASDLAEAQQLVDKAAQMLRSVGFEVDTVIEKGFGDWTLCIHLPKCVDVRRFEIHSLFSCQTLAHSRISRLYSRRASSSPRLVTLCRCHTDAASV
ncbi:MAG: universal stress protein [Terriglobia bacterium]